jgi:YesN/AraC family two-component response regulator
MHYLIAENHEHLIHISSGQLISEENFIHQHRNLDTFVLIICLRGTLYITQDEKRYKLKENQFLTLFSGHEHYGYRASEGDLCYFWCHFQIANDKYMLLDEAQMIKVLDTKCMDFSTWNRAKKNATLSHRRAKNSHFSQYYIIPEFGSILTDGRAVIIFRQLLDMARKDSFTNQLPNYALSLLALEISQEFIEDHFKKNKKNLYPKMEKIVEWVRINYSRQLSLAKIARIFRYNPDYLSTVFHKYSGIPLMKYICHIRITNAKKLLISSNYDIKEIAWQVGFENEKNFMKQFKKYETITPTTYRNAFNSSKIVN